MQKYKSILAVTYLLLFITTVSYAGELKLIDEKTFSVGKGEKLELKTAFGDVEITSWNKNEVSVKIYGNKRAEKKLSFNIERTDYGVLVESEKNDEIRNWFNWFSGYSLKYEIKVPVEYNTFVKTAGGDVTVSGINGGSELTSSGGDITIKDTKDKFVIVTSGGDIGVESHSGQLELSTSGGDVRVTSSQGSVKAKTSGGDIVLETADGSIEAKTSGGDIKLNYNGQNKGIELATSGGDIKLRLPSDFSAGAELTTLGGDINIDFKNSRTNKMSSSKFVGELNNGGILLLCKTSGGDIILSEK